MMNLLGFIHIFFFLLLLLGIPLVFCQQQQFIAQLLASDGATANQFGQSVSISGNSILIGANGQLSAQGAAYVFSCDYANLSCSQTVKLLASDGAPNDEFGTSVAIETGFVAIGAYAHNQTGAVYVFLCNQVAGTCQQTDKLVSNDIAVNDGFGYALSLSGNLIAVGAFAKNALQGAAYVFSCELATGTCQQVDKLLASDGATEDYFGYSIDIYGSTVVVGAFAENDLQGAVYLFSCNSTSCQQFQKLTAYDAANYDSFGLSVGVTSNEVLVGAPGRNGYTGGVYVWVCDFDSILSCNFSSVLLNSDATTSSQFGAAIASFGNLTVVGAPNAGDNQGAGYDFHCQNGLEQNCAQFSKVSIIGGSGSGEFGDSVAVDNGVFVIAASQYNGQIGTAYVFLDNGCLNSNCLNGAACVPNGESFTCDCLYGYYGSQCQSEYNFCLGEGTGNNCSANADCQSFPGGFKCTCGYGFIGDGVTCTECPYGETSDPTNTVCQIVQCEEYISENMYFGSVDHSTNETGICNEGFAVFIDDYPDEFLYPIGYCGLDYTGKSASWDDFYPICEETCFFRGCENGGSCVGNATIAECACVGRWIGRFCQEKDINKVAISVGVVVLVIFILIVILGIVMWRRRKTRSEGMLLTQRDQKGYQTVSEGN